jgi:uncharacterized alkaline shock family protein YloU
VEVTEMTSQNIGDSGYTLEELADYHERGRMPADAAIEGDPQCRAILDSMDRLGTLSRALVEHDAQIVIEESWFEQIIGAVARESRAGRDLPLSETGDVRLVVTEGAVRGLVRDAGDSVEGVVVESVDVAVLPESEGESIDVALSISVLYGVAMRELAERVRDAVASALHQSTPWTVGAVDVIIDSLRTRDESAGKDER